MLLLANQS